MTIVICFVVVYDFDFIPLNDLSRWVNAEREAVQLAIANVVNDGIFIGGLQTSLLEQKLGKLVQGRHIVSVGNGTDALVLSLLALGIGSGDLVATVANAGGYATNAILQTGATPILIDVEIETAQMSGADLSKKISCNPQVKAAVVTHLYGLMADMDAIVDIAADHGIFLIEDCAQSIGANLDGIPAGAFGDASTFSFYPTKNLGCLGDGGAVAMKSDIHANLLRSLAQYGWTSRYVVDHQSGMNSRIDEIQAAVLNVRFESLEEKNLVRREIIQQFQSNLTSPRRIIFSNSESFVGHLAVLISPDRARDQEKLADAGIQTAVHFPVLDHHQSAWRNNFVGVSLPNSEFLANQILTLPCFPLLNEVEISRICTALSEL